MTFLYDIKKSKPNEQLIFPTKVPLLSPPPAEDLIDFDDKEQSNWQPSMGELHDIYHPDNRFLGGPTILTTKGVLVLSADIQAISCLMRNKVDSLFYLLRRGESQQKALAIETLKCMLLEQCEMMKVFYVFRNLVNTV